MEFAKYQHIERFGTDEVLGIELGTCFIFPKIDGTNGSTWLGADKLVKAGSRNRELTVESDNAGFYKDILQQENIIDFLNDNPKLKLFGEWLCLSGDTKIRLLSGGKRGHVNTLKDMYEYQEKDVYEESTFLKKDGTKSPSKRLSWWKRYGMPQTFSLFQDEDIIKPQKIKKIIKSGKKIVYEVSTRKGYKLKSSLDHKFYTTTGWKPLCDIKENDVVATSDLYNFRKKRNYGKGARKITKLFKYLRENNVCAQCGIDNSLEVHHINEDWRDNNISNLQVICRECHSKIHKNITAINQSFNYNFDKVISIIKIGEEECYDVSMDGDENSASFIANGFVVHNCPHSLKTYRDSAWRQFYVFDVLRSEGQGLSSSSYMPYYDYKELLEEYDIKYIPPICEIRNPSYEQIQNQIEKNTFLIKEGEGIGEGIVIKNYNFVNKYGRTTWAKIVTNEFKEKHTKEMGSSIMSGKKMIEEEIVEKYCTESLIEKTYAKIKNDKDGWSSKYIPELLSRVYHDLLTEEIWNIVKKNKLPTINFKTLNLFVVAEIKRVKPEVF